MVLVNNCLEVLTLPPKTRKVREPVRLRLLKDISVSLYDLTLEQRMMLTAHFDAYHKPMSRQSVFIIPAGFEFDGASIPRGMDWFAHRYGLALPAALVHDYFCAHAKRAQFKPLRELGDDVFVKHLMRLGVKHWRAVVMGTAVKLQTMVGGV